MTYFFLFEKGLRAS